MKQIRLFFIVIMSLVFLSGAAIAQNAIKRVEPPFWWTGFKDSSLQLLVYGEDISLYEPKVGYAGVTLEKVTRVKSPNYLFIDLKLAPGVKAGKFDISFTREGVRTISYPYELKARRKDSAARKGFDSSDAIYLITPDRFANGLPENDVVVGMPDGLDRSNKDGRHGGDIQGIIDHLDYISDMGFTAIWSTPLLENNQQNTSYHGYAITDLYKQDPRFGSNEDYRNLSRKARSKGIGLIMDMVANHIGSSHWWMKDLPGDDWLNSYPGDFVQSNHMRNTLHDPHASRWDRDRFSDGWFVKTMPDLNQRNPLLARYLIQNSIWWVEYADLSGIRMDTYSYPDMDFMADWSRRIMTEYPDFNIVGEEYVTDVSLVSYWQRGKVNSNGYISWLPSLVDFPLQDAMVRGLLEKEGWKSGLIRLYEVLSMDNQYPDTDHLVIMSDNHDMNRLYTQLGEDFDLYRMAIASVFTMRGIPEIYYGTEILKVNPDGKDDGKIRSDFPGGWAGDKVNAFTGRGLSKKQAAAQALVKKLANWRKDKAVIHNGKLMHFLPEDGTYVYFRYDDQDKVMVVLNKNKEVKKLKLDRFSEMLAGKTMARDVITGENIKLSSEISLAPRSVMILEIR